MALIVFFKGKSKNFNLANQWKRSCNDVIAANFAHFGTESELSTSLE